MTTTEIDPVRGDDAASGASRQLVCFTFASQDFAVPIARVQEIIQYTPPRPMPGSAPDVEGIINLRDRIIPVINLRARLGVPGERAEDSRIVIVDLGERAVGVEVDSVREVLSVQEVDCEPASQGAGAGSEAIDAVAKLEGRLLVILDLDRLLGASEAW